MNTMPTAPAPFTSVTGTDQHASCQTASPRIRRLAGRRHANRNEKGEGVISLAIAVLIMAVIGAAMYLVFSKLATDAGTKTTDKVATIN